MGSEFSIQSFKTQFKFLMLKMCICTCYQRMGQRSKFVFGLINGRIVTPWSQHPNMKLKSYHRNKEAFPKIQGGTNSFVVKKSCLPTNFGRNEVILDNITGI